MGLNKILMKYDVITERVNKNLSLFKKKKYIVNVIQIQNMGSILNYGYSFTNDTQYTIYT